MSEFMQGIQQIIAAMMQIWGVEPERELGTYVFETDPYPLTTSAAIPGTAIGTLQISQAGAFVLVKHAIHENTQRDVRITWVAGGSDRRFTSSDLGGHIETMGGSDEFPFIYPKAYIFDGGTTVSCKVSNTTTNARICYWDFIGWRIWNVQALNLTRRSA